METCHWFDAKDFTINTTISFFSPQMHAGSPLLPREPNLHSHFFHFLVAFVTIMATRNFWPIMVKNVISPEEKIYSNITPREVIFFRLCLHMDNLNKEHGAKFSFYSCRTSRVYSFLSRQFALNLLPCLQKLPWGERASGTSPLWKKYVLKGWTDTVYFKTPARLGPLGGFNGKKER